MNAGKTRLGVMGTGFMAQLAHLPAFAAAPGCEIAALASHRPELAGALAAQYGIPKVYNDYGRLWADPEIEAVICLQPFHNHYRLGRQILEAGKGLLTEKPMATRLSDGRELVELAERQGLVYGVGFMKRHDPGVQLARQQIHALAASGDLGALKMVDARCLLGDWLQNAGAPVRRDEPAAYPATERRYPEHVPARLAPAYDYFNEVFCHNLNLIRFLLPDERLECLSAASTGEDTWAVTLASGGVLVSLRGAKSASHRWEETTDFVFEKGRVCIRTPAPMNRQAVAEVSVYARQPDLAVSPGGGAAVERRLYAEIEWSFVRQARSFVAAVQGQAPFAAPGRDCLRDLELVEEVFRVLAVP